MFEVKFSDCELNLFQKKAPYEQNLARAVSIGPVTVAIEVVNSMYTYGKGIYDETDCKTQVDSSFSLA